MEALDSSEQPVGSPSPTSGARGRIITSVRKVTQWILMRGTLGTAEEGYTTGKKMELRKSRIQRCPTKIQGEPQVWATCVILNFIAAIFYNIIIQYVIDIKIVNDIYYLFILSLKSGAHSTGRAKYIPSIRTAHLSLDELHFKCSEVTRDSWRPHWVMQIYRLKVTSLTAFPPPLSSQNPDRQVIAFRQKIRVFFFFFFWRI